MQKCLKDRYIYSPKLIRDLIFAELRAGMTSLADKQLTVSQLLREASTQAEEKAQAEGVKFEFWRSATDGVLENLVAAQVLLDEHGRAIEPGPHARGTKVSGLSAEFENQCEGYLLEYLIVTLGDVSWPKDRTALAHALFKVGPTRKEVYELQDRVDELMALQKGRIVEKKDGTLSVEP
ncbi:MAG: hypothetical protein CXZ00_14665 [Acidobacteria bacterium]|nr:MAG: hypothetical protein CXZ00_14665 [Acidobacteriota bacterium]